VTGNVCNRFVPMRLSLQDVKMVSYFFRDRKAQKSTGHTTITLLCFITGIDGKVALGRRFTISLFLYVYIFIIFLCDWVTYLLTNLKTDRMARWHVTSWSCGHSSLNIRYQFQVIYTSDKEQKCSYLSSGIYSICSQPAQCSISVFQPMGRHTYLGGEAIVNSYNFIIPLLTNPTILVN
jgi:hypothetical protein